MKNKYSAWLMALLISAGSLKAQDIHLSHIHASPTFLNPAMTGLFDGDYRFAANYKQQWRNTTANYRTLAIAFDSKIADLGGNGYLAAGINLYGDKAGDLDFSTTSAMFSIAAAKSLTRDGNHTIMAAVQGGLIRNSIDYSKLYVFNPEPSVIAGAPSAVNIIDASAGIGWFSRLDDHLIYGGFSAFHIAEPDLAMIGKMMNYREELARKWVFHGGGEFEASERFTLMPSFIMMEQSPHREVTIGTFLRYDHSEYKRDKGSSVYFGTWFRWFVRPDINTSSDALILSARLDQNRVVYAFSYDINLSTLTKATKGFGGPELSVIYTGNWNGDQSRKSRHKMDCPKF